MPADPEGNVYLRPDVQVDPLFNQWYAWPQLIPPATAALQMLDRYLPMMKSYVASPQMHVAALKNHALRGGPFIDLGGKRIEEIRALLGETTERYRQPLEFARALKQLGSILAEKAKGMSLESIYADVPEILKGYVELCYDLNNSPSYRVLETLLYRGPYYREDGQAIALTRITRDKQRPFVMSTPRLAGESTAVLNVPFREPALDELFRMKREARPYGRVRDRLGVDAGGEPLFRTFFTEQPPAPPAPAYDGDDVRIRYFGHACLLIESGGVRILVDPLVSYAYPSEIPRYSFADLPDPIDYVLLTHSHHDHVLFETLLQIRHMVKTIVVGRNWDGLVHDPSLQLALRKVGFPHVVEAREFEEIAVPGGCITTVPFLGEHHDFQTQSKLGYHIRLGQRSALCIADSCNLEPSLYDHVVKITGEADALFLGMECDGAPPSWLFGPYFSKPLPREIDRSRRARGCNFDEATALVDRFRFKQVYVYAMGQEPWLGHILDNEFTEESNSLAQSRRFIDQCKARGLAAESLFGRKEIWITQD